MTQSSMKYCQQQKSLSNYLRYGDNNINTTDTTDYPGTYAVHVAQHLLARSKLLLVCILPVYLSYIAHQCIMKTSPVYWRHNLLQTFADNVGQDVNSTLVYSIWKEKQPRILKKYIKLLYNNTTTLNCKIVIKKGKRYFLQFCYQALNQVMNVIVE